MCSIRFLFPKRSKRYYTLRDATDINYVKPHPKRNYIKRDRKPRKLIKTIVDGKVKYIVPKELQKEYQNRFISKRKIKNNLV